MTQKTPQREQHKALTGQDTVDEQEERMEGEGQAAAPGQEPQPETESSSDNDLNAGKNVQGPNTTSKD